MTDAVPICPPEAQQALVDAQFMARCFLAKHPEIKSLVCGPTSQFHQNPACQHDDPVGILQLWWQFFEHPCNFMCPKMPVSICDPPFEPALVDRIKREGCAPARPQGEPPPQGEAPASCAANQINLLGTCVDQSLLLIGGGLALILLFAWRR